LRTSAKVQKFRDFILRRESLAWLVLKEGKGCVRGDPPISTEGRGDLNGRKKGTRSIDNAIGGEALKG